MKKICQMLSVVVLFLGVENKAHVDIYETMDAFQLIEQGSPKNMDEFNQKIKNYSMSVQNMFLNKRFKTLEDIEQLPINDKRDLFSYALFAAGGPKKKVMDFVYQAAKKKNEPDIVNMPDKYGYSMLHNAVVQAKEDVVKALADFAASNGAALNPNTKIQDGETPLRTAIMQRRPLSMIKMVLAIPGIDLNATYEPGHETNLMRAVVHGDIELAKLLVTPENVNIRDDRNRTPLFYASTTNNQEMVKILKEKGGVE